MPDPSRPEQILDLVKTFAVEQRHPLLALVEPAVAMLRNDSERATVALERNLAHPDLWVRSMLHLMSAMQAENSGDTAVLEEQLPLALGGFRANGDRWGIGQRGGRAGHLVQRPGSR